MQAATSGNGISSLVSRLALCLLLIHAVSPAAAAASHPSMDCAHFSIFSGIPTVSDKAAALPAEAIDWLQALIRDFLPDWHGGSEALTRLQGEYFTGSLSFSLLGGTFLGALLFGYPYRGIGIPDLAALAVFGFIFVYVIMAKTRSGRSRKSDARFTVGQRDASSTGVFGNRAFKKKPDAGRNDTRGRPSDERKKTGAPWGLGKTPGLGNEDGLRQNRDSGLPERDIYGPDGKKTRLAELLGIGGKRTEAPRPGAPAKPEATAQPFPETFGMNRPGEFDPNAFMEGARTLYIRLQDAWAARDVEGLSPFMTPDMMRILREQAKADPHPVKVGILQIAADILTVEQTEYQDWVAVAFAVLMSTGGLPPVTVHEIWHFARERTRNGTWRLAGIEPDGE